MSFGEYVDLDAFIGSWQDMHKAMAILFRPIRMRSKELYRVAEYEGEKTLDDYAGAMKEIPVNIALGALVFFYRLGMKLVDGTMNYLESHPQLSSHFKDNLPNDGDGIRHLLHSQMEMSLNSMKYQRFHSVKP